MKTSARSIAATTLLFIFNSCSDDNLGTARATYPSMTSLSSMENETPLTSLSNYELQALKQSAGGLIGIGFMDVFIKDGVQTNERSCNISGRFLLLSREEKPDQERKRFARTVSVQLEQCRFNADSLKDDSYDPIEMSIDGTISTAISFIGTSQAKPELKAESVQVSQANSGSFNIVEVSTNTTTNIQFSNLVYAANVSPTTQDDYNQISADPLGAEEQAARKLEFWRKLLKCSGSVQVNGKSYSCTKVAVTLLPHLFH